MTHHEATAIGHGTLYHGDNLDVLRALPDASVDLIYLDPPFCSQRVYDASALDGKGERVEGFDDRWRWGPEAEQALKAVSPSLRAVLGALREATDDGRFAYLVAMAQRLPALHRVLAATGGLYLHCDPTASHYLKVLLDVVFGARGFRNEVIWRYRRWPAKSRQFQRMHDVLLYYTKSDGGQHVFHTLYGYEELAASTRKTFGTKRQVADFASGHRKPSTTNEESAGPPLSDVWEVPVVAPSGHERTGYPTQKPEALLERVILASSNVGDVVLDPYCGSGTTLVVAQRHGRRWVGIDKNQDALALAFTRVARGAAGA